MHLKVRGTINKLDFVQYEQLRRGTAFIQVCWQIESFTSDTAEVI